ncbi:unnamed protein product, partial [Musa acuminata var. zebrina]
SILLRSFPIIPADEGAACSRFQLNPHLDFFSGRKLDKGIASSLIVLVDRRRRRDYGSPRRKGSVKSSASSSSRSRPSPIGLRCRSKSSSTTGSPNSTITSSSFS